MDGPPSSDVTLRTRLRDHGALDRAAIWGDGTQVDAASLRADTTAWRSRLRAGGVRRGDRVVCALPAGSAFATLLLAGVEEGWTLAPVPRTADAAVEADAVDARAVVGGDGVWFRDATLAPTPDARFLLATSGTTGAPRRIALSDTNITAVLDTHVGPLALGDAIMLSVLPWHHAFGLVLELLPALLSGATLMRDPSGGRDVASMLAVAGVSTARERPVTHLHAVPYTARLLAADPAGMRLLASLRGGLIGGAPVDAALADALGRTALRVGYGQTEASPGISLGVPGAWRAGTLGTALGCRVRLGDDGVLEFRGPNACVGEWRSGMGLERFAPGRWVRTGDLAVAESDGGYTFVGRAAESFKLENGRYVAPLPIEAAVRVRFPMVREAVLSSRDGVELLLALESERDAPSAAAIRPLLGALAGRPLRVVPVARDAWVRTPKGEIDRRFPAGRHA